MTKALVTGAGGFLGSAIVRRLLEGGWLVTAVGNGDAPQIPAAHRQRFAWLSGNVSIDLLQRACAIHGSPDVVVHAAGSASVARSWEHPYEDYLRTVNSTAAVVEFMRSSASRAHLVYPSSAAVYGNDGAGAAAPLRPVSPYGSHKVIAETLCTDAMNYFGIPCTIVRFFSLFGPGLRKQLLWDVFQRLHEGTTRLELQGTGREHRDFLYVDDAVELVARLCERPPEVAGGSSPAIINGGRGVGVSVAEVASAVIAAMSLQGKVDVVFSGVVRQGDPLRQVADTGGLRNVGFEPRWSFQRGVDAFVSWARQTEALAGDSVGGMSKRSG